MQSVGEKIAQLRKERKMTQEELANLIGVSSQSVSKWENNVTAPDIMLLPILAGIFEVTIDALFSLEGRQKSAAISIEETPLAVYDAILETMWAWEDDGTDTAHTKRRLQENPKSHTGFISMTRGGVYADRNLALTYIADPAKSAELLTNEEAAAFLQTLADPHIRRLLKYQLENKDISYTIASASVKCGMKEEDVKAAFEALVKYALMAKQTVDMGPEEKVDIYSHCGGHKFTLLIYPLLSLAMQLSDFQENWCGFRN